MGKRTAQKDTIIDITSDSQVNSNFPYRWSPASLTFNNYFYIFLYLYITRISINNNSRKETKPGNKSCKNKSDKKRPCVDYRRLNAITIKDAFPIHRITDCLEAVSGAKLFSSLDLTSSFHLVPIKFYDIPKTVFCTKYGLYGVFSNGNGFDK